MSWISADNRESCIEIIAHPTCWWCIPRSRWHYQCFVSSCTGWFCWSFRTPPSSPDAWTRRSTWRWHEKKHDNLWGKIKTLTAIADSLSKKPLLDKGMWIRRILRDSLQKDLLHHVVQRAVQSGVVQQWAGGTQPAVEVHHLVVCIHVVVLGDFPDPSDHHALQDPACAIQKEIKMTWTPSFSSQLIVKMR